MSLDQKKSFEDECRRRGKTIPQWSCETPRGSAGEPPVPPAAPAGEPPVGAGAGEVGDSPMEEDAGEEVAETAGDSPVGVEPPAAGPPAAAAGEPPVGDATPVPKAAESPSPGAEGGSGEDAAMAPAVSPAAEDLSPASIAMDDEDAEAEADYSSPAADAAVAAVAAEPAVGAAAEPATYVAEAASDRYIDCLQCGLPTAPKLCTFGLCQTCCDRRPAPASGVERCAIHFFSGAELNTGDSLPPMPPVAP